MKIVAWNINHRIREKVIPDQMTEAIVSLGPDVIVLTEYVHGPSRDLFLARLADHGFCNSLVSACRPKENHVLIAARSALEHGTIRAPEIGASLPSNALHVRLPDEGVEILGLRVPDYSQPKMKRVCWDWIIETAAAVKDLPFAMIGDFNTDPKYPPSRCGDRINLPTIRRRTSPFQLRIPRRPGSTSRRSTLPGLPVPSSSPRVSLERCGRAGPARPGSRS